MKRNIFVDPDIGNTLKKFTMYFSVFFLVFGLTMIIRNAGDTYALDGKNCPLGWPWNSDYNRCVSTNTFSTLDICKSAIETLGREYDEEGGNTCIKLNSTNTEWTGLIYSQCTVNFNANGGSVSPTSKTVNCGETVTVPTPTKSGYVFDKWYYYTNLGTVTNEVEKGGKVTVDVDGMDLVAGWIEEEVEEKVTVTFDAKSGYFKYNGTKLSDSSRKFQINKGDSIILISTDSSKTMTTIHRDDYKFDGWSESSTSCDSVLSGGKEVQNVTVGKTYYACWTKIVDDDGDEENVTPDPTKYTYKAIFDANDGTLNGSSTGSCTSTGSSCKLSSLPTATREGYTFGGWGTSKTCTSGDKTSLTLNSTSGKTYYACWSGTEYQLTFNVNGGKLFEGTTESTSLVRKISSVDYSKFIAKKDNNTFDGWSTDSTCTNPKPVKTGTLKLTKDTTLYACYTEDKEPGDGGTGTEDNKTYTVKFILNGGKLYKGATLQKSNTVTLSTINSSQWTAKKEGNIFKYWSKKEDCSKKYAPNGSLTDDLVLYACYDPDKTSEEVDKSPQTGSGLLYFLFIGGIIALGFIWYNAYKYSEVKK